MSDRHPPPDATISPKYRHLIDAHQHFERLMAQHQEALVGFEIDEARRLFEELRRAKVEHMQFEESELLPPYATGVQWDRGGRPELFQAEHNQIYHLLNTLTHALEDLARPGALTRQAVIDLLDAEKSFKGVLEHHVLRESFHLYPGLSRIADA